MAGLPATQPSNAFAAPAPTYLEKQVAMTNQTLSLIRNVMEDYVANNAALQKDPSLPDPVKTKLKARKGKRLERNLDDEERLERKQRQLRSNASIASVSRSIDGHRVDPFDALPIRTDTSVDQLARWHFQCCNPYEPYPRVQKRIPWMQMCTAFWSRSLWEIGLKDPTLFQAVLCVAQAKFALLSGRQDNAQYYIIKGRVVSTVRDRVMSLERARKTERANIAETFIVTVSILEALALSNSEEGEIHSKAVAQLITKAGGLATVSMTSMRVLFVNELRRASSSIRQPRLPHFPPIPSPPLSSEMVGRARILALKTLPYVPALEGEFNSCDLIFDLHLVTLAFETQTEMWHPATVLNTFHRIMYQMCATTALVAGEGIEAPLTHQALVLTCQMLLWRGVFDDYLITPSPDYGLFSRLCQLFLKGEETEDDILDLWKREAHLKGLLWVLFTGIAFARTGSPFPTAADSRPVLPRLLRMTDRVMDELEMGSYDEFERAMKIFPWVEHYCIGQCRQLWKMLGREDSSSFSSPGSE